MLGIIGGVIRIGIPVVMLYYVAKNYQTIKERLSDVLDYVRGDID